MRRIPLLAIALLVAACGAGEQKRPVVVSTFPADGQILAGWLAVVRVTFDEPVSILNEAAVTCEAIGPGGGNVGLRLLPDATDPASVLAVPASGGHFVPGLVHLLTVREGAVVNDDEHYLLDEVVVSFTVGPAPNLFLSGDDGNVYEVDPATGTQVAATVPPAGFEAKSPASTDGRLWVWLDPTAPGSSALGTFLPGTATISQTVALSGETGTRAGRHLVVSADGRTVYATAEDAGTNRLVLHRIDAATQTEIGSGIALSPALAGSPATFRPALDVEGNRLFVPFSDGAGGGFVAVVDLAAFAEIDAGPLAGVDALPVADGAGDCSYDRTREAVYMALSDETTAGLVKIAAGSPPFATAVEREPFTGTPTAVFAQPDGGYVVYGLDGYSGTDGLVRVRASRLDEGFVLPLVDDVGGSPVGCDSVAALLHDPTAARFYAFADDGSTPVLALFDFFDDTPPIQVDLDAGTDGVQAIDLSAATGGALVTGATVLLGATP